MTWNEHFDGRNAEIAFEKMVQEIQAKAEAEWRQQEAVETKLSNLHMNMGRAW